MECSNNGESFDNQKEKADTLQTCVLCDRTLRENINMLCFPSKSEFVDSVESTNVGISTSFVDVLHATIYRRLSGVASSSDQSNRTSSQIAFLSKSEGKEILV